MMMLRISTCNNITLAQVTARRCFETSASLHRQSNSKRKEKKPSISDPEEEKSDCVGPPDPFSNLRVVKFYVPPNETPLEYRYRMARAETQDWNQEFWAHHNANFKKMKADFIMKKLQEKYGDDQQMRKTQDKKTLSADEMSQFYKSFLDDNRFTHKQYNTDWYKRNINNVILAARVWLEQTLKTRRR